MEAMQAEAAARAQALVKERVQWRLVSRARGYSEWGLGCAGAEPKRPAGARGGGRGQVRKQGSGGGQGSAWEIRGQVGGQGSGGRTGSGEEAGVRWGDRGQLGEVGVRWGRQRLGEEAGVR